MKLDFYATRRHFIDHLLPIWKEMPLRGRFFVSPEMEEYAKKQIGEVITGQPRGIFPVLTCAYGDMGVIVRDNPEAKVILAEHGIGMTYGTSAYADGRGRRLSVSLFLMQSEYVANKIHPDIQAPRVIIGIPKLDPWAGEFEKEHPMPEKPTVAISFHHSNFANIPEAQNAWEFYKDVLPDLAAKYPLIGTGHPLEIEQFSDTYRQLGIEVVEDFNRVMRRADILIFDNTSAGYEFLVTGKPVILLNCPKFRKDKSFGIRFWDYSNIGPQVERKEDLIGAIEAVRQDPDSIKPIRAQAVHDLLPYVGVSVHRAVTALTDFVQAVPDPEPTISIHEICEESNCGIMYMCFGERARAEVVKSIESLRGLEMRYPVCVVGDTPVPGTYFTEWMGKDPFDPTRLKALQFLAGRIKPHLYSLSPFQKTLYLDADTRFRAPIQEGFDFLNTYDVAIAEENQTLQQLHNPSQRDWNVSWYHHMPEVEASILELGDPNLRFLNSGVIFFRKSRKTELLFENWSSEWERWGQWDEQMAFLRAVCHTEINVKRLPIAWNNPRPRHETIIQHLYARGSARREGI